MSHSEKALQAADARDEAQHDFIDVLAYALDDDLCEVYIEEAEIAGEDEVATFFRQARGQNQQHSQKAEQLIL